MLNRHSDGDKQFVEILGRIGTYGLDAVTDACAEAIRTKTPSSDMVLNILSRIQDDPEMSVFSLPKYLPVLRSEPLADCGRYDALLVGGKANA